MFHCLRCFIRNYGPTPGFMRLNKFYRLSSSSANAKYNSFSRKSHSCGELDSRHAGETVTLCGWVQFSRMEKFLTVRDWQGATQVILPEEKSDLSKVLANTPFESVVEVSGTVQCRPEGQLNKAMKTGDIEVIADELRVVNLCRKDMPFQIRDFYKVKESLRMEYRYLDLRSTQMQRNLRLRSNVIMKMREFLCNMNGRKYVQ